MKRQKGEKALVYITNPTIKKLVRHDVDNENVTISLKNGDIVTLFRVIDSNEGIFCFNSNAGKYYYRDTYDNYRFISKTTTYNNDVGRVSEVTIADGISSKISDVTKLINKNEYMHRRVRRKYTWTHPTILGKRKR